MSNPDYLIDLIEHNVILTLSFYTFILHFHFLVITFFLK
jgi:hypothetical protein